MKHSFYAVFVDKLIILRWPTGQVSESDLLDAITSKVASSKLALDYFVGADLLITDAPGPNGISSYQVLTQAFQGSPGLLRQFELWDFKGGRFHRVKRKWRKQKLSYH